MRKNKAFEKSVCFHLPLVIEIVKKPIGRNLYLLLRIICGRVESLIKETPALSYQTLFAGPLGEM